MKNLFVPYKIAVLAKQYGFNEKCLTYYGFNKKLKKDNFGAWFLNKTMVTTQASAPIYQQIIDWFRIKHGIDIAYKLKSSYHRFEHTKAGDPKTIKEFDKADSGGYYGAFDKAIEEAFKLLG